MAVYISSTNLFSRLNEYLIIDIRSLQQYQKLHLKNSSHLPLPAKFRTSGVNFLLKFLPERIKSEIQKDPSKQKILIVDDEEMPNEIVQLLNKKFVDAGYYCVEYLQDRISDFCLQNPNLAIKVKSQLTSLSLRNSISPSHICKITDKIYLSDSKSAHDLQRLDALKIKHLVNCAIECENPPGLNCLRLNLTDNIYQILNKHVIMSVIDYIQDKERVLIYCQGGVSRSPTIVIAVLMFLQKSSYQESYRQVMEARHCIAPNFHFASFLMNWQDMY